MIASGISYSPLLEGFKVFIFLKIELSNWYKPIMARSDFGFLGFSTIDVTLLLDISATPSCSGFGTFFRNNISDLANVVGFEKFTGYFQAGSSGVFRYMIHGIPEIAAYFIAGLAGGIVFNSVIRKNIDN